MIVEWVFVDLIIFEFIGIFKSLSMTILEGDYFSNPRILQSNLGLSSITVLALVKMQS